MNKQPDTKPAAPYGTLLGTPVIAGVAVALYSNGDCGHLSTQHSHDDKGRYLGVKYQCVEFVRRFVWAAHGINLASIWHDGDAAQWVENAAKMGLASVTPEDAQKGDIVVFSGGAHGHIAVICDNPADAGSAAVIAGQNLFNDERDMHTAIGPAVLAGTEPLCSDNGSRYFLQSILRVTGT